MQKNNQCLSWQLILGKTFHLFKRFKCVCNSEANITSPSVVGSISAALSCLVRLPPVPSGGTKEAITGEPGLVTQNQFAVKASFKITLTDSVWKLHTPGNGLLENSLSIGTE